MDGRWDSGLLLLRHWPGLPHFAGQLQHLPQQLLQVGDWTSITAPHPFPTHNVVGSLCRPPWIGVAEVFTFCTSVEVWILE